MPRVLAIALALSVLAPGVSPAFAASHSQLVKTVQFNLVGYGFEEVDASLLSRSVLSQLHLTMTGKGDRLSKERKVRTILEKAGALPD